MQRNNQLSNNISKRKCGLACVKTANQLVNVLMSFGPTKRGSNLACYISLVPQTPIRAHAKKVW